jgi:aspartyl protease family protein
METLRHLGRPLGTATVPGTLAKAMLAWALLAWVLPAQAQDEDLRAQILDLAASEGFLVSGLEQIDDAAARKRVPEDPLRRIRILLSGYNYLLLHDRAGGLRELWILEPRPTTAALVERHAVGTTRRGPHHVVETALVGPNGRRQKMALTLDTGATTIVLPREMIPLLGFQTKDLRDGWSRTAAGRVPVKLGRLKTVKVGHALAKDVAVAFLAGEAGPDPDDELALLGMSFLKRFRLTIEDAKHQIILMAK